MHGHPGEQFPPGLESLLPSLTALVGEDTQSVEASTKALQVTSAEKNPSLGLLTLKHPGDILEGMREMNHGFQPPTYVPRTAEAPGDEQSLPFGEGWIVIVNTVHPGDIYSVAVGETKRRLQ